MKGGDVILKLNNDTFKGRGENVYGMKRTLQRGKLEICESNNKVPGPA